MPNANLRVLIRTYAHRDGSKSLASADFASLFQAVSDATEQLFQAVPVMIYPTTPDEHKALATKMEQSFRDTAALRRMLGSAIDALSERLYDIWSDTELPLFMEEPDPSDPWSTAWIFPIADEVLEEIEACKRELYRSDEELSAAHWFLESSIGFEDFAEGRPFYCAFYDESLGDGLVYDEPCDEGRDNSEFREHRRRELQALCDKYRTAVQKMFDLATKARADELADIAACKAAYAAAHPAAYATA